jgi:hypothetical protein
MGHWQCPEILSAQPFRNLLIASAGPGFELEARADRQQFRPLIGVRSRGFSVSSGILNFFLIWRWQKMKMPANSNQETYERQSRAGCFGPSR